MKIDTKPPDEYTPRDVLARDIKIGDWSADPVDFHQVEVISVKRLADVIILEFRDGRISRLLPDVRLRVLR